MKGLGYRWAVGGEGKGLECGLRWDAEWWGLGLSGR